MIRPVVIGLIVIHVAHTAVFGQFTSRSDNQGFENGLTSWVASGNYETQVVGIQQRNWSPDTSSPVEARLGSSYLAFTNAATVGYGQFVVLAPDAERQVLACQGYKNGGWAGFGITYYDSSWNEVEIFRKRFGASTGSNRGDGDGMRPHSLGCVVPDSAVFAYIWVWQEEVAGEPLVLDEFALFDYQTSDPENLVRNGEFVVGLGDAQSTDAGVANVALSGWEFWENDNDDGSIFYDADTQELKMGDTTEDLIYQRIPVVGTQNYTMEYGFRRTSGVPPWTAIGIDFFDIDGNFLGNVNGGNAFFIMGLSPDGATRSVNFTPPVDTAYSYAWVWTEGSSDPSPLLNFREFRVVQNEADTTQPTAALASPVDPVTEVPANEYINFVVNYIDDRTEFIVGSVSVTGPDGSDVFVQPFVGGTEETESGVITWELNGLRAPGGSWGPEDNGVYTVSLDEDSLVDEAGNVAVPAVLGTIVVDLPQGE